MTEEKKLQNIVEELKNENSRLKDELKIAKAIVSSSKNKHFIEELTLKSEEIRTQNEEIRAINEELVATNEALKESEEHLSQILDESVDAIIHSDKTGQIFYANKSAEILTGYTVKELLNLNLKNIFTKASVENEPLRYDLVTQGKIVIRDRSLLCKTGQELPVEVHSKKLPQGEIQTIMRDMSERKKREELNLQFKKIFTQSPDGIFQIDKNGYIVNCNQAFADSLLSNINDIIGRHAIKLVVDKDFATKTFKEFIKKGYYEAEVEQYKADGSKAIVWRKAVALKDNKGQFNGAFVFSRDITKRIKQAELHLKLSTAVEQSANIVFITDTKGTIEYVNNKFVEFTGYSREEAIGKNPRFLKSGKQSKQFYEKLWKTIKAGKQWSGEFQNLNKAGELYWESATISPVFNRNGEIINFIAVKENITERKRIALELKKKNREYERLNHKYEQLYEKLLKLNIELEEQSQKYRDIFNVPNDCIFIHDLNTGIVIDTNSSIYSMFGYRHEEVTGKTIEDLSAGYPPYDIQTAAKNIELCIKNGTHTFEWLCKHKNGNLFWTEVNLKLGKIGGVERILATVKDISERKKQEEKLKESEERFRAIFNNSPDIILLAVADNPKIINANNTFTEILGYSVDEIKQKSTSELNLWVDRKEQEDLMSKVLKHGFIDNFEARLRKKTGEIIHVLISIRDIYLKGEKHFLSIIRDITESLKVEQALIESEQKFKELADLSPTGIFIYQNNNFVYVNKATCDITGYNEKELLKMKFWDVVHEDMKDVIRDRGHKRMQKEDVISRYEIKLRAKNGDVKWVDFSAGFIMYQGKPSGIGNVFDITERKKAQEQLIEAKKKAEESDRLKSAFLANMSHEIRTPMNGIVGFSELLAVGDLPEEQKQKYIQVIRQSSDQLLHIINDILDISKIEVGEVKIIKSKFNISHLLLELKSLFATQIKHSRQENIELMLDYKLPEDKEILFSDRFRLHQIISNLINNALKFTEKGFVAFGARFVEADCESIEYPCGKEEHNRVLFFVKDSGTGIPPKMQEIIFDRFRQSDDSTTKKHRGTGLGLSIAKGLIQILGGNIWLISKRGEGSVFYFTIPYKN